MRQIVCHVILCLSTLCLPSIALPSADFADWRVGDFIFHESTSSQASAIRIATGSRYTHMGIVDRDENGFHVLEAGRTVTKTPLSDFMTRGVGGEYAVYRIADLDAGKAALALNEAKKYLGRPYDIFFRLEPDAIYCSELPYYAFQTIGLELGTVERLGDLQIDTREGREIFLSRWQDHPDCKADDLDREGCWSLLKTQSIVTPLSIARDPKVERLFSTIDR